MANAQPIRPAAVADEELDLEIDDSSDTTSQGAEQAQASPIVVLSRDLELAETVRKAAPRGIPVLQANDLDQIAAKLPALQPGVLVVDMASTSDAAALVAQLTQHFPELVVVIAGKREDSSALMQLTAAGRVFRFLLTPLTHGQTRLALEAAATQHRDLKAAGHRQSATDGGGTGDKNYLVTYGALAAGLLLLIGAIWFGIKQFSGQPAAPMVTAPGNAAPAPGVPEKPDPVKAELTSARQALAQDKLLEPNGESALDYYRSALALDPNSQEAKSGIRAVADKLLARAEAALTAERLEEAVRNIEYVRDIDSSHPRLAFLDTQLVRERERLKLTEARDVSNRVRKLVDQAADRASSGRLISPANGNARDALLEARRLDPTDPMVAQAIRDLSAQLIDEAGKSLAAGRLDEARAYAGGARQLGSAGSALSQIERALANNARPAAASPAANAANANAASRTVTQAGAANVDALIAEIRQRLIDGKLIEPPGENARDALSRLREAASNRPEVEELSRVLTTRLVNSAKQAGAAKSFDRAAQLLAAARAVGARYDEPFIAQAETELAALRTEDNQQDWVSAGTLKRTRMVDPVYPDTALKRGIEGWAEVAFTVTADGSVEDVEVRNSTPPKTFDDAAIRAVRQWRFEPVEHNGQKVPQRAVVRLRFVQPR